MRTRGSSFPGVGTMNEPFRGADRSPMQLHPAAPEGRPGAGFREGFGIPGNPGSVSQRENCGEADLVFSLRHHLDQGVGHPFCLDAVPDLTFAS